MDTNINISYMEKINQPEVYTDDSDNSWGGKEWKKEDKEKKEALGIKMEPRYFTDDYNKNYKCNDLSRIYKGTFDVFEYFKQTPDRASYGPWRWSAFVKAEGEPQFKKFIDKLKKTATKEKSNVERVSIIVNKKYVTPFSPSYKKTDNDNFEKFVNECRSAWNEKYSCKSEIKNYEDAFQKALTILQQAKDGRDPFWERRVEVLYDNNKKVYLVNETADTRACMCHTGGYWSVLLNENGEILAINGGAFSICGMSHKMDIDKPIAINKITEAEAKEPIKNFSDQIVTDFLKDVNMEEFMELFGKFRNGKLSYLKFRKSCLTIIIPNIAKEYPKLDQLKVESRAAAIFLLLLEKVGLPEKILEEIQKLEATFK